MTPVSSEELGFLMTSCHIQDIIAKRLLSFPFPRKSECCGAVQSVLHRFELTQKVAKVRIIT
jgi:hypothetical protein